MNNCIFLSKASSICFANGKTEISIVSFFSITAVLPRMKLIEELIECISVTFRLCRPLKKLLRLIFIGGAAFSLHIEIA